MKEKQGIVSPETIRKARDALGENQHQFAARFGIRQSTLSRWENGRLPKQGSALVLLHRVLQDIGRVLPVHR